MARRDVLLAALDGRHGPVPVGELAGRVCEVAVARLGAQGVGVALISSPQARGLLSSRGALAGQVEDLQFSLGEGPCLDAFAEGVPALEGDLTDGGLVRWPMFANAAVRLGVRGVFAFPLQVGTACFGVLDVVRQAPGLLEQEELADALTLADIATETVLLLQTEGAGHEVVADELGGVGSERIVVHQATGMVSAQADISIEDALARLRAHAFAQDRLIRDVAEAVVGHSLRFHP